MLRSRNMGVVLAASAGMLALMVLLAPWKAGAACNAPGGMIVNISIAENSVGYHVCVNKSTTITVTMDHPYAGTFNWTKATGSDKITLGNANQATVTVNGGPEPSASKDDQTITAKFTPDNPTGWILDDCYAEAKLTVCKIDPIAIDVDHDQWAVAPGSTCTLSSRMHPQRNLTWSFATFPFKNAPQFTTAVSGDFNETCEFTPSANSPEGYVLVMAYDSEWTECVATALLWVGCQCSSCQAAGGWSCLLGCVDVHMYFGSDAQGRRAGQLWLMTNAPSASLATPAALQLMNPSTGMDAILTSNTLRQILAPECLADIVTNSPFKYTVSFYKRDDVESAKGANGLYLVKTGRSSFTEYRFENPAASTNDVDTLLVVRTTGPVSARTVVTNEYVWTGSGSTSSWALTSGNGLKTEEKSSVSNGATRIETRVIKNSSGVVVAKTVSTFEDFPWGEVLTENVNDPDGAALRTSYNYFTATNPVGKRGKLQMEVQPEGGWTRYDYDSQGRMTLQVSGWKDSPTNAAENQAHVAHMGYTPVDPNDTAAIYVSTPRVETNTILGHVAGITWRAYYLNGGNERVEILERTADVSSHYGNPENERNTSIFYPSGTNAAGAGRIKTSISRDGRQDSWTYEYGTYMTNSNPASNNFMAGTGNYLRSTVTHGTTNSPSGIAGKTTREVTIEDPLGRNVMQETLAYTGSGYERVAWSAYTLDDLGRPTKTCQSDGTISESEWGCCGKTWELNASGVERDFSYDSLDRNDITTKQAASPLITALILDAAGRPLKTTKSAGGLALTSSNLFDNANRKIADWNEAGLVTSYSYSDGGRISTTVQPGNATNITENYLDGRRKSITGNAKTPQTYDYGVNSDGSQWTIVYTGPAGTSSPMWSKTTVDMLGRTILEERPAFSSVPSVLSVVTNSSFYNSKGQLIKSTSPGHAATLYEYNEFGEQIASALDVDGNNEITTNRMDRITALDSFFEKDASTNYWRVSVYTVYAGASNAVPTTNSIQKVRLTGLGSVNEELGALNQEQVAIDLLGNATTSRTYIDRSTKTVTQTTTYPDSTNSAVSVTVNGVLVSASTRHSTLATLFSSDALERPISFTDPRTGTATTHYNDKGQVDWVEDAASNKIWFSYDETTGRQIAKTNSLGKIARFQYDARGNMVRTWGETEYPISQVFDDWNRVTNLATYRGGTGWGNWDWPADPGTPDITVWSFDIATGLLTNKLYADGKGTAYEYTSDGRPSKTTWARGYTTEYAFDPATGDMTNINCSAASTPNIAFTFDRLGRQATVVDWQGTRTFSYSPTTLQLVDEVIVAGGATDVISRTSDSLGRSDGLTLGEYSLNYGFDNIGRFSALSSTVGGMASNSWQYFYLANSALIEKLTESGRGITNSRSYEANRDLITAIENRAQGTTISKYQYSNDALGRRTQRIDAAGGGTSTNSFEYNARSELTNAVLNGRNYGWIFDNIGNRVDYTTNGVTFAYTANNLNQYTQITNGEARTLTYDFDGNLVTDGKWTNVWNGENRVVRIEPMNPSNGSERVDLAYDYMGRRFREIISTYSGSAWAETRTNLWVYDGWKPIRETVFSTSGVTTNWWVHGLDFSGSLQGAGGIGGFLSWTRSGDSKTFLYSGDANGNVTELVDASSPTNIVAAYQWDAYGDPMAVTGPEAQNNTFRWSSKYVIAQTGDKDFGYRILRDHRWMSRDPIEEVGFSFYKNTVLHTRRYRALDTGTDLDLLSPYMFALNNPTSVTDGTGLQANIVSRVNADVNGVANFCGHCGPEITTDVFRKSLAKVSATWKNLDQKGRSAACRPYEKSAFVGDVVGSTISFGLYPLLSHKPWIRFMGWDFAELYQWEDSCRIGECGTPSDCSYTVWVGGACYNSWEVNYLLYGWLNRMCGISREDMTAMVTMYKASKDVLTHEEQMKGALSWAKAGHELWPQKGSVPSPSQSSKPPTGCLNCSQKLEGLDSLWPGSSVSGF